MNRAPSPVVNVHGSTCSSTKGKKERKKKEWWMRADFSSSNIHKIHKVTYKRRRHQRQLFFAGNISSAAGGFHRLSYTYGAQQYRKKKIENLATTTEPKD